MSKNNGLGEMLKFGIILALYAIVACVGLAFVYEGTAKIIAERQQADLEAAIKELFPAVDDFKSVTDIKSSDPAVIIEGDGCYAVFKNGQTIGMALRTSRAGYNGPIIVLVGVGVDGKISGARILAHTETPGLGANSGSKAYYVDRAKGIHFYDQFAGKSIRDPFEPKNDVIAITAATITSRAVASSVKVAGEAASAWFAAQGGSR
jgi:electron transport complex protein RnfG